MDVLTLILYVTAVVLLALAAFGVRAGRVSLPLLAAALLVLAYFVLPELV